MGFKKGYTPANKTHGLSGSSIFIRWQGMHTRCYNTNHKHYKKYGGRGIEVCQRWHKFENFFKDMGHPPEGLTLDRIDNNKGYSLKNCRWASRKEQNRNKSTTRFLTHKGKTMALPAWEEEMGFKRDLIRMRIDYCGWSTKDAIETKTKVNPTYLYKGEWLSIREAADKCGILAGTLTGRVVRLGWSIKQAMETPVGQKP